MMARRSQRRIITAIVPFALAFGGARAFAEPFNLMSVHNVGAGPCQVVMAGAKKAFTEIHVSPDYFGGFRKVAFLGGDKNDVKSSLTLSAPDLPAGLKISVDKAETRWDTANGYDLKLVLKVERDYAVNLPGDFVTVPVLLTNSDNGFQTSLMLRIITAG